MPSGLLLKKGGKGELGRGAISKSGRDVTKNLNPREEILSNPCLLRTSPQPRRDQQAADPISWDPLKLANEEGRWGANGVDAITRE